MTVSYDNRQPIKQQIHQTLLEDSVASSIKTGVDKSGDLNAIDPTAESVDSIISDNNGKVSRQAIYSHPSNTAGGDQSRFAAKANGSSKQGGNVDNRLNMTATS